MPANPLTAEQIAGALANVLPADEHMLLWFARNAQGGCFPPFSLGLVTALSEIEIASPGYAMTMLSRLASIRGTGDEQAEQILQILCEVYVTQGGAISADRDENSPRLMFTMEPGVAGSKRPEFEARHQGAWYCVETKAPRLLAHSRARRTNPLQVATRLDRDVSGGEPITAPRDNPVKDFLISADSKFAAYALQRPEAARILTIVWDDFCFEPIAALLGPSGLLTQNSFCRVNDQPVAFPHIDAIVVCRYQHQLYLCMSNKPMGDGESIPFVYHKRSFPWKALIQNPAGRTIPDVLFGALDATPLERCIGAEYRPIEFVMWTGTTGGR